MSPAPRKERDRRGYFKERYAEKKRKKAEKERQKEQARVRAANQRARKKAAKSETETARGNTDASGETPRHRNAATLDDTLRTPLASANRLLGLTPQERSSVIRSEIRSASLARRASGRRDRTAAYERQLDFNREGLLEVGRTVNKLVDSLNNETNGFVTHLKEKASDEAEAEDKHLAESDRELDPVSQILFGAGATNSSSPACSEADAFDANVESATTKRSHLDVDLDTVDEEEDEIESEVDDKLVTDSTDNEDDDDDDDDEDDDEDDDYSSDYDDDNIARDTASKSGTPSDDTDKKFFDAIGSEDDGGSENDDSMPAHPDRKMARKPSSPPRAADHSGITNVETGTENVFGTPTDDTDKEFFDAIGSEDDEGSENVDSMAAHPDLKMAAARKLTSPPRATDHSGITNTETATENVASFTVESQNSPVDRSIAGSSFTTTSTASTKLHMDNDSGIEERTRCTKNASIGGTKLDDDDAKPAPAPVFGVGATQVQSPSPSPTGFSFGGGVPAPSPALRSHEDQAIDSALAERVASVVKNGMDEMIQDHVQTNQALDELEDFLSRNRDPATIIECRQKIGDILSEYHQNGDNSRQRVEAKFENAAVLLRDWVDGITSIEIERKKRGGKVHKLGMQLLTLCHRRDCELLANRSLDQDHLQEEQRSGFEVPFVDPFSQNLVARATVSSSPARSEAEADAFDANDSTATSKTANRAHLDVDLETVDEEEDEIESEVDDKLVADSTDDDDDDDDDADDDDDLDNIARDTASKSGTATGDTDEECFDTIGSEDHKGLKNDDSMAVHPDRKMAAAPKPSSPPRATVHSGVINAETATENVASFTEESQSSPVDRSNAGSLFTVTSTASKIHMDDDSGVEERTRCAKNASIGGTKLDDDDAKPAVAPVFGVGATQVQSPSPAPTGFSFGGGVPAPSPALSGSSGFSFGGGIPAPSGSGGFSFGGVAANLSQGGVVPFTRAPSSATFGSSIFMPPSVPKSGVPQSGDGLNKEDDGIGRTDKKNVGSPSIRAAGIKDLKSSASNVTGPTPDGVGSFVPLAPDFGKVMYDDNGDVMYSADGKVMYSEIVNPNALTLFVPNALTNPYAHSHVFDESSCPKKVPKPRVEVPSPENLDDSTAIEKNESPSVRKSVVMHSEGLTGTKVAATEANTKWKCPGCGSSFSNDDDNLCTMCDIARPGYEEEAVVESTEEHDRAKAGGGHDPTFVLLSEAEEVVPSGSFEFAAPNESETINSKEAVADVESLDDRDGAKADGGGHDPTFASLKEVEKVEARPPAALARKLAPDVTGGSGDGAAASSGVPAHGRATDAEARLSTGPIRTPATRRNNKMRTVAKTPVRRSNRLLEQEERSCK